MSKFSEASSFAYVKILRKAEKYDRIKGVWAGPSRGCAFTWGHQDMSIYLGEERGMGDGLLERDPW